MDYHHQNTKRAKNLINTPISDDSSIPSINTPTIAPKAQESAYFYTISDNSKST